VGVEARSFSVTKALLSTAGSSHIKAIADGVNEADLAAWLRGHSNGTENSEDSEGRKQPAREGVTLRVLGHCRRLGAKTPTLMELMELLVHSGCQCGSIGTNFYSNTPAGRTGRDSLSRGDGDTLEGHQTRIAP